MKKNSTEFWKRLIANQGCKKRESKVVSGLTKSRFHLFKSILFFNQLYSMIAGFIRNR